MRSTGPLPRFTMSAAISDVPANGVAWGDRGVPARQLHTSGSHRRGSSLVPVSASIARRQYRISRPRVLHPRPSTFDSQPAPIAVGDSRNRRSAGALYVRAFAVAKPSDGSGLPPDRHGGAARQSLARGSVGWSPRGRDSSAGSPTALIRALKPISERCFPFPPKPSP